MVQVKILLLNEENQPIKSLIGLGLALGLSMMISPIPPPKKAEAVNPQHIKKVQLVVMPPVSTQPQAVTQPESPPQVPAQADTTAAVETPTCVYGFSVSDYYENLVMQRESSGNSCATNYLGCVGLFQACPGSKLYAACPTLDVNCQLTFFTDYMLATYGSWANAWNSEVTRGWW